MTVPIFFLLAQQVATEDLADIREPVLIIDWLFWSMLGAIAVLVAILVVIWIRRYRINRANRPAGPPPLPPADWARQELDRLASEESAYPDKEYVIAVSGIVREYLERAFDLPAPERTTDEFLAEIGDHRLFTPEMRGEMSAFLQQADLVKFAGQPLRENDRTQLLERARRFVSIAEHDEPLKSEGAA